MRVPNFIQVAIFTVGWMFIAIACETQSQPLTSESPQEDDSIYQGIEFEMPKVKLPSFSVNSCTIAEHGAIGDGFTNNSEAFVKAIDAMVAKGGGKVIVPRGIWLTGPIVLKSNINLHLEAGALIVFSKNFDHYSVIKTSFEGLNTFRCQSPISGESLENIAITGSGIIDGSGDAWRPVKKDKLTARQWDTLVKSGGVVNKDGRIWYPTVKSMNGDSRDNFNIPNFTEKEQFEAVKDFLRPVMVSLINCKKVLLDGPTFQNSPAWNIHPLLCEDITIRNLNIRNPWYSQNGDGLDLESCKNALIYNNTFDVGDDAICIKSGKNKDGRDRGVATENVIVKNNIVFHGHGGFTVGSEMSGGVKNVHISNCTFIGTDIGLRFKSTRGRGGVVENIYISNIDMMDIPAEAIRFNMFYEGNSPIPDEGSETNVAVAEIFPVNDETPSFKNIFMKNITVTHSEIAGFFQGLPEMHLKNIRLENSTFETKKGITIIDAEGIEFINVRLVQGEENALTIFNSKQVTLDGFSLGSKDESTIRVMGKETEEIEFKNSAIKASQVKLTNEVVKKEVFFN